LFEKSGSATRLQLTGIPAKAGQGRTSVNRLWGGSADPSHFIEKPTFFPRRTCRSWKMRPALLQDHILRLVIVVVIVVIVVVIVDVMPRDIARCVNLDFVLFAVMDDFHLVEEHLDLLRFLDDRARIFRV